VTFHRSTASVDVTRSRVPRRALASEDADDERESGDGAARVRDVDVVRARRARDDDEIDGATLGTVSTRDRPGARLRR
jgi:hypothetical protein